MRTIRIAVCSALLAGCAAMPSKPIVMVGGIDYPRAEVIEGLSDGSDPVRRVPLSAYDKATCFRPADWEQWKSYVRLVEEFANTCSSRRPDEP